MNKAFCITVLLACLFVCQDYAGANSGEGVSSFYSRNAPETLIQLYEDPERQEWQKPQNVVDQLFLKPGDVVADIGAGTGYFSVLFAKKVAGSGTVYAVDIDRNMLEYVSRRVEKDGLGNIKPVLAKSDDPMLAKDSADLVFICNTYMFIANRGNYLTKLKNALKNDGRLVIISYNLVDSPEGPPIHTRVSKESTVREVVNAGFVLDEEYFFLPYQHFLVFKRQ